MYSWLMVTEVFNASLTRVMRIGPSTYYEAFLPTIPVRIGRDSTLVSSVTGRVLTAQYVLANCRTRVAGTVIAQAPNGVLRLLKTSGQLRITRSGKCAPA